MKDRCIFCEKTLEKATPYIFDTRFGIDDLYGISCCGLCGLEQTYPVPTSKELKRLYERHYNFSGEKDTAYTRLREKFLFSFIYKLWIFLDGDISFHGIKGTGRLLDIGCNEGRGLTMNKENGWQAEGLELNMNAARIAAKRGFTVKTIPIEDFKVEELYDVAVLSNVLEHSTDPKAMLTNVRRVLRPGGQVWISCPNNKSWQRTLFGKRWINWHVPFHISHFSPKTLKTALEVTGFNGVEIKNRTPALWLAHSLISLIFTKRGSPLRLLRNPLLVAPLMLLIRVMCFPLLWLGNVLGKGDCLVVRAKRN